MSLMKKIIITGKIANSLIRERITPEDKSREKEKRENLICDLKKEVEYSLEERKESDKNLNLIQKAQKGIKGLPIITIVDDLVEGASGIEKIEELVRSNPENPFVWMILAETLKYRRKTFLILNGLKAPFDPIGTVLDVSTEYAGTFIESAIDKEKWTYERALRQAIELGRKGASRNFISYISVGRSAYLLKQEYKEVPLKRYYADLGDEYLRKALGEAKNLEDKGEVLFYMAIYNEETNIKKAISLYNESRLCGFVPSVERLKKIYKKLTIQYKYEELTIPLGVKKVERFSYSYSKGNIQAAFDGTINMVTKQGKKIVSTTEKIFDKIASKTIKK